MTIQSIGSVSGAVAVKRLLKAAIRSEINYAPAEDDPVHGFLNYLDGAENVFVLSAAASGQDKMDDIAREIIAEAAEEMLGECRILVLVASGAITEAVESHDAFDFAFMSAQSPIRILNAVREAIKPETEIEISAYIDESLIDKAVATVFIAK
ncbi:MAG: hypothetical protein FWB97_05405 [Oscillospiraceae bacterium]|nr:hypothetical protein [Oscillospiraceae bacterium]